jgi:hypothetical protein
MNDQLVVGKDTPVSLMDDETSFDAAVFNTAVNHCFEKLDKLVMRLHRYPLDAVTVAMGTYLQELLGALFDEGACTVDDARAFLRDIESGILELKDSSPENEAVPLSSGAPRSTSGTDQTE